MIVELPGQLDLFDLLRHVVEAVDGLEVYVVEVGGRYVPREVVWFAWACSCGAVSAPGARWSHADLAEAMGREHGEAR